MPILNKIKKEYFLNKRLAYMMSTSNSTFYFDSERMECVLNYRFSRNIDFYSSIVPLSLCLAISLYTLLRCYILFRKFPEEMTRALLSEIKYYPLIFIFCNIASFIEIIMKYQGREVNESLFVIDQLAKGLEGGLICLVFFWKRLKFKIVGLDEISRGKAVLSKMTDDDLKEIERVE